MYRLHPLLDSIRATGGVAVRALTCVVPTLIMAGCVMPLSPSSSIENRFNIPHSDMDAVWTAAIQVFADREWRIEASNEAAGIIYARDVEVAPRRAAEYMECRGDAVLRDTGHVGDLGVALRQDGEDVVLTVNAKWLVVRELLHPVRFHCESTGRFEQELYESVVARMR